ncbi:hypothetical protein D8Y24_09090 [Agrococcus lahaulensis]|nr:hypothetical protein D8Y24_09090 [Agrococcus lahaulensis]
MTDRHPLRTGSRQLEHLRQRLPERDHCILQLVSEHRFITTMQLQRLCFADHRTTAAGVRACRRVLERLQRLRILTRLERQIGGAGSGSQAHTWHLDTIGDRLTRTADGPRRRAYEPSTTFLTHTLAVAEARTRLEEAARLGVFDLRGVAIETAAGRAILGQGGGLRHLRPDLIADLQLDGEAMTVHLEVDLGTETYRTLIGKCELYARWASTLPPDATAPLVVWQLPSETRLERLSRDIQAHPGLDPDQFALTTPDGLIQAVSGEAIHDSNQQEGGTP